MTNSQLDESRTPWVEVVASPSVPVEVLARGPVVVHVVSPSVAGPAAPQGGSLGALVQTDLSLHVGQALARRGPTRVIALSVAGLGFLGAVGGLAAWSSVGAFALVWLVPGVLACAIGLVVAARGRRGLETHPLEHAALSLAAQEGGALRAARLALVSGHPLHECEACLGALVRAGHATVDADEAGLVYRVAVGVAR